MAQYEVEKEINCPGACDCLCRGTREINILRTNNGDLGCSEIS